jgi:hypothetical protein
MWPFNKNKTPKHAHDQRLTFRFKDLNGNAYFQLPDDMAISPERLSILEEYIMWMAAGMSNKQFNDYLTAIETADLEYKKNGKNPGLVPAIIHDMRMHKGRLVTVDIYYNYLALFYFRQDEHVGIFSQQIQNEKANAFKEASNKGSSFFFHLPELKKLYEYTNITSGNWHELVRLSAILDAEHSKKMGYYSTKE